MRSILESLNFDVEYNCVESVKSIKEEDNEEEEELGEENEEEKDEEMSSTIFSCYVE